MGTLIPPELPGRNDDLEEGLILGETYSRKQRLDHMQFARSRLLGLLHFTHWNNRGKQIPNTELVARRYQQHIDADRDETIDGSDSVDIIA